MFLPLPRVSFPLVASRRTRRHTPYIGPFFVWTVPMNVPSERPTSALGHLDGGVFDFSVDRGMPGPTMGMPTVPPSFASFWPPRTCAAM